MANGDQEKMDLSADERGGAEWGADEYWVGRECAAVDDDGAARHGDGLHV